MTDESKRWIEAAKRYAEDPTAEIRCPRCGKEGLQVMDAPLDDDHINRHVMCSFCDAYDIVQMRRSELAPRK